jgi:branched-subunit amino acid transport protein
MNDLDKTLQTYLLDKAPKMPADIQKLIVQYGPYLVLIGTVMGAVSLLNAFGTLGVATPFMMMGGYKAGMLYQLSLLFFGASVVLSALSLPGLFKKTKQGWQYAWYNGLLTAVMSIVTLNIFGLIIGSGIGFYILYQIKHHYK